MKLEALYTEYRVTAHEMRNLLDVSDAEGRDLTGEEQAKFDRLDREVSRLQANIRSASGQDRHTVAEHERTLSALEFNAVLRGKSRGVDVVLGAMPLERRDLVKGTASAGGNTVPTTFWDQLREHMIEVSGLMLAGPTVLTTTNGADLLVPRTTAHGTAALITEGGAISESDATFGQATMRAWKYARLVQVTSELLEDTAVDLLGYVARDIGRSIGNLFGAAAVASGNGTTAPQALAPATTVGVTGGTGVAGAFTADNLLDLYYSVIAPYRSSPSCAWLMRDSAIASVRKLKDSTGQYLWQPSIQLGAPEILLGKPIYTDSNVPAVGLNGRSVLFGDMSAYYVRIVNSMRFERSDGLAFANDLVTFRGVMRMDGRLVDDTGAIKCFVGGAS